MAVPAKDKKNAALEDYLRSDSIRGKMRQMGADDVFVNYKEMSSSLSKASGASSDTAFIQELIKEMQKVSTFFESKEKEYATAFEQKIKPLLVQVCLL